MTCIECDNRSQCKKPCEDLYQKLKEVSDGYYEKRTDDGVMIFSQNHQLQCAFIENEVKFSNEDQTPWCSGDFKLRQTNVFIDRFFGKMSFQAIAEKYKIDEHTAETSYHNAFNQVEKVVRAMDSRKEGIKHSLNSKRGFTDHQKFFLLVKIFGFSGSEVAQMFDVPVTTVNRRVRDMTGQFLFVVGEKKKKPVKSVYEGLSKDEMVKRMTGQ